MERNRIRLGIVTSLFVMTLMTSTAFAAYVPPLPTEKPVISNVSVPANLAKGTSAVVKCRVTWHYQPGSWRTVFVKIPAISSAWKQMSTTDGTNFEYNVTGLSPSSAYSFTIKASEWIWYAPLGDYIKLTSYAYGTIDDCIPTISVTIKNIQEQQVECEWSVNWGRTDGGTDRTAFVKYKHGSGTTWRDLDPVVFSGSIGSTVLPDLVMATNYDCQVKVSHTESGVQLESGWISKSFTSSSWTPNRKYALNINLNNDTDDGVFHAHNNTLKYLDALSWSSWGYYEHSVVIPDNSPAETLTGVNGELRWPNWCETPSDENSFVFIFIVGHGGIGKLLIGGGSVPPECEPSELAIAQAIASISYGKLVLVIEACYSGSLIDGIVNQLGPERMRNTLIITSANSTTTAGVRFTATPSTTDDECTFASAFLPVLASGGNFFDAFDAGGVKCFDYYANLPETGTAYQDPRLDDIDNSPDVTVGKMKRDLPFFLIVGKDGQLAFALRLH